MITEAIVLAGGLGTRLKPVVADLPKSLAPVSGKPFLSYLLSYAKQQGIEKFIFALGYKSSLIERFVASFLPAGSFGFSNEEEPLGTGGAIFQACKMVMGAETIVLNADTFFGISFDEMSQLHHHGNAQCTVALKPMKDFSRYGAVEINTEKKVTGFSEKKYHATGLINGGVYALSIEPFLGKSFPPVFSFEKDYLETEFSNETILGLVSDAYFIDIGIPEDFKRSQTELIENLRVRF